MSLGALTAFVAAGLGLLLAGAVFLRGGDRITRWAFFAGMLALALQNLFAGFAIYTRNPVSFIDWEGWRIAALAAGISPWLVFSLAFVRGDGPANMRRWFIPALLALLVPVLLAFVLRADLIVALQPSDFGFQPTLGLGWPAIAIHALAVAGSVVTLMQLERTYRATVGTMRWRIKFMVLGLCVILAVRLITGTYSLLFQEFNPRLEALQSAAVIISGILIFRSLLRAGQFEFEVYPSQSLIRNSVTIAVVGLYLVFAGITAKLVGRIGGGISFPKESMVILLAIVLLTIALMSDRLRLSIARFVSRNFQRPVHDYREIWRQFTEATSSPQTQEQLCRRLVRLTADTLQTQSVSLWLYDDHAKVFTLAASTALADTQARNRQPSVEESALLHQQLGSHPDPLHIENMDEDWACVLKRCHPAEFHLGGKRICAPLLYLGDPLGLLILGDRIGGLDFSTQDTDLVKCVADHAVSAILNVSLSRQLVQTRELAAFQTMAAFFVHDLKNAASTLNLMLPNLQVHWDTPGFREDALRGIAKTVTHINHLVSRLGQLRGELTLNRVQSDLSGTVAEILSEIKLRPGVRLSKTLETETPALLDPEQLRKVITNLVLNACEAMPSSGGEITVTTSSEGNWTCLSVQDSGCGMSPDFLQKSLFRPFQTTKKEGLGIGMFHSRMIVEAHGGRIKVESTQGSGTTFTLLFPRLGANTRT